MLLKRRPIDGVQQMIMLFVSSVIASHRISSLQNTLGGGGGGGGGCGHDDALLLFFLHPVPSHPAEYGLI